MTVGSLFAGIGGFDLGFERAGFDVIWQCEKDAYCQKVLSKHWPDIPVYDDVQTLYTDDGPQPERPDILIGGFPCQDISWAGLGKGLNGERSGLWYEYHRIIRVCRPRYVVAENVAALTHRGLDAVLCSLAEIGYDAEWTTLTAAQFGADHKRERIFIIAHPDGIRSSTSTVFIPQSKKSKIHSRTGDRRRMAESRVQRVVDGIPRRVDRLRGLGNAIVPQVAKYVAHCVRQHASRTHTAAEPQQEYGYR